MNKSLLDKKLIKDHTNTEWVNKAGLVYLEYATQVKDTRVFSLKDIIVMVKYIENNLCHRSLHFS